MVLYRLYEGQGRGFEAAGRVEAAGRGARGEGARQGRAGGAERSGGRARNFFAGAGVKIRKTPKGDNGYRYAR